MASIDLPRPLHDYFAFAETAPTRNGRRFSITLSYMRADGRLDRLQWWYHLSPAKEMALGDAAVERLRSEAIERFSTHIERWLSNTRQDMFGDGAIPYVAAEGNRVVAAYMLDPAASEGIPTVDEEPAGTPLAEQPESVEPEAGGAGTSPPNGHRQPNKSAFG
jgi:hypothetical protein